MLLEYLNYTYASFLSIEVAFDFEIVFFVLLKYGGQVITRIRYIGSCRFVVVYCLYGEDEFLSLLLYFDQLELEIVVFIQEDAIGLVHLSVLKFFIFQF